MKGERLGHARELWQGERVALSAAMMPRAGGGQVTGVLYACTGLVGCTSLVAQLEARLGEHTEQRQRSVFREVAGAKAASACVHPTPAAPIAHAGSGSDDEGGRLRDSEYKAKPKGKKKHKQWVLGRSSLPGPHACSAHSLFFSSFLSSGASVTREGRCHWGLLRLEPALPCVRPAVPGTGTALCGACCAWSRHCSVAVLRRGEEEEGAWGTRPPRAPLPLTLCLACP